MNEIQAALYGLIQGVTEYLPISSSAHLILFPKIFGIEDPGLTWDVFLHFPTLLATLIYYRKEWVELLNPRTMKQSLSSTSGITLLNLIIGTIPAVIAGLLFHKIVESVFRNEGAIAILLVVGALMLYLADKFSRGEREVEEITWKDALGVGFFQCLALMHGISRSGSTMSGARFLGLNRRAAAKFSFMLSAPITLGAIVFELRHFSEITNSGVEVTNLLIAVVSTFIFGYLAISFLMRVLRRVSFLGFAIYRILLALYVYIMFRAF